MARMYTTASGGLTTNPAKAVSYSSSPSTPSSSSKTSSGSSGGTSVLSATPAEQQTAVIAIPNAQGGYDYYYNPQASEISTVPSQQIQGETARQTLVNVAASGGNVTIHSSGGGSRIATPAEVNQMVQASVLQPAAQTQQKPNAILTDVKAGRETYNFTRGPAFSRFIATQGREGLPFALNRGNIGYVGTEYTAIEYNGKSYVVMSGKQLSPGQQVQIQRELKNASPEYLARLGVVDIIGGGNPFGGGSEGNSRYGKELLYESGKPSGVFAKYEQPSFELPKSPYGYSFYDEKTGQAGYVEFDQKYFNQPYSDNVDWSRYASYDTRQPEQPESNTKRFFKSFGRTLLSPVIGVGKFLYAGNYQKDYKPIIDFGQSKWLQSEGPIYKDQDVQNAAALAVTLPFASVKIVQYAYYGYLGYQGYETAKNPTPENLGSLTAATTPLLIKPIATSYKIISGKFIPEPASKPVLVEMRTIEPQNLEVNTRARTFKNLQLETQPKTILEYQQTFKKPFFGTETARVIVERFPLSKQVTRFNFGGVEYEFTKFPELKTTEVFKQNTWRGDVIFQQKLPIENLNLEVTNFKSTVPIEARFKPSESQINQIVLQESFFDVKGTYAGKKIKGFGKANRVTEAVSKADYSRIIRQRLIVEEGAQEFVVGSDLVNRRPLLESGKPVEWTPTIRKEIIDLRASLEIQKTILEIGNPNYWADLKTKNYPEMKIDQRVLEKQGVAFNPERVQKVRKTRITKKGQVDTRVTQLTDLNIKFASGKNIKKIYKSPKNIPQATEWQVPEGNRATTPKPAKIEDLSWLNGRQKTAVEVFEQNIAKLQSDLSSKGVSQNNINKAVAAQYVKNYPTTKVSKLEVEQMQAPSILNFELFSTPKNRIEGVPAVLPRLQPLPKLKNPMALFPSKIKSKPTERIVSRPKMRQESEIKLKNVSRSMNRSKSKVRQESRQEIRQESRQEIRQETKQQQKQEIRQQQRQRQQIKNLVKTNLRPVATFPGPKGFKFKMPDISLSSKNSKVKKMRPIKQLHAPTPTAYALAIGLKGKEAEFGTTSGLGVRPIDFSKPKKRRK